MENQQEVPHEARKASERLQERRSKDLAGHTVLVLLSRLRALLTGVTKNQSERDRRFLKRLDEEDQS
jgi:hypothetical protein